MRLAKSFQSLIGCQTAHQLVACMGADDILGCQLLRNLLRQVR